MDLPAAYDCNKKLKRLIKEKLYKIDCKEFFNVHTFRIDEEFDQIILKAVMSYSDKKEEQCWIKISNDILIAADDKQQLLIFQQSVHNMSWHMITVILENLKTDWDTEMNKMIDKKKRMLPPNSFSRPLPINSFDVDEIDLDIDYGDLVPKTNKFKRNSEFSKIENNRSRRSKWGLND